MKAIELNDKELRREIYALRRALRRDLGEVKTASRVLTNTPTYALTHMRKAEKQMRDISVRKMSQKDLLSTYRQLRYIRGLKSSTLEGAMETAEKFEPIAEHLRSLTEEKRKEFWNIYGELYKYSTTLEQFKYELIEYADKKFGDELPEDIVLKIEKLYEDVKEVDDGKRTDEEIAVQFSNELQDLLSRLK